MLETRFTEALLQTYGSITTIELLRFMATGAMGSNTETLTIAGVAAATWFGGNTLPFSDLVPTGIGRLAFLMGCLTLAFELVLIARANRRPALADITNRQ